MSHKKKYKSVLGSSTLINAPNYLAEKIIKKRADKKGVTLPDRIWDRKKYGKSLQYKYWCGAYWGEHKKACEVLKKYDEDCAVQAIQHHECSVILSLHNEKFRRIAQELQDKKELEEKFKEKIDLKIVSADTLPEPKKTSSKSKLGKLR